MHFSNSFILAAFAAISQVSAAIHFSSFPETAVPSTPTTLEWTGGDTTNTITITLKKAGTVVAVLLQRNGQATSFDWTPAGSLENGSDYTLEITQGTDTSDTPEFTVGATATSSSAEASATSAAATSAAATSASATATSAVVTSLSTVAVPTTAAPVTTTIAPVGNITSSGSIPISTFTTLPGNATSTGGSGSNGTATGSSPTPTNTIGTSNGASSLTSSMTLLVGAAAAIAYFC